MQCYVAFLRGINVGGRIVKKGMLQKVFTSLGFRKVSTYRQSGNVIFEAEEEETAEIKARIEKRLSEILGYEVAVFVRTNSQLKAIIDSEPFKGQRSEGTSFLVTFLEATPANSALSLPLTIPKSTALIISEAGTEIFSVTHGGGEGALPNPFLEKTLKIKATTRNLNVIRSITEKMAKNS
jgi:uncharacterized protein (DUF1697 family)